MSDYQKWIDPAMDGSGGGYGKSKGLTVRELSQTFAKVAEEPNMRSVTGILRICREQLEARSQLGVSTTAAASLGVITLILAVSMLLVTPTIRDLMAKAMAVSAILFIGFLSGAISTRKLARAAVAQDRAIREIAIEVLDGIVMHPLFRPSGLDSVQKQTLRQILKKVGGTHSQLEELLSLQES